MKKKSFKSLKLKKTNVAHLTGGICKCKIRIPGTGIADGQNQEAIITLLTYCCPPPDPDSEKSNKDVVIQQ